MKSGTILSFKYVLGSNLIIRGGKKRPINFQSFISRAELKEDKLSHSHSAIRKQLNKTLKFYTMLPSEDL